MNLFYKSILLVSDILLVNLALGLALLLRFDLRIPSQYVELYKHQWIVLVLIHLTVNMGFRLYRCLLRYITTRELLYISGATLLSSGLYMGYGLFFNQAFPRTVYLSYTIFLLLLMILSRFSYKFVNRILSKCSKSYLALKCQINGTSRHRTLLIGAGDAAAIIVKESKKEVAPFYKIVAALDDDKSKHKSSLNGVPIVGSIDQLEKYIEAYKIDTIIVALPTAGAQRIAEVLALCSQTECQLKIFSGISSAISEDGPTPHLRNVKIEDLLGRDEIVLDAKEVKAHIQNQTVLVTGGGGSIGSELCRQISALNPTRLIIFDIYENNAYDLQNELLRNGFPKAKLTVLIGSVRDKAKLEEVFSLYKPNIVFHAAAHKHVPLMEDSPSEAIKNNVFGTMNTALCARDHKVKKFILISTDKAVNPTNVMGTTKRLCELIVQSINKTTPHTDFVAVRFGNVLGSNGSVIPLFKRQLEEGGPLTVTHPDIIRYFMTIPEAVRLILQAMSFAEGGEIFVLDMGEPVKILDLALNFIKLSGLEPYTDVDIKFTGLRPGEKLYEELLMDEEGMGKTSNKKIFIGTPSPITFHELAEHLKYLHHAIESGSDLRQALHNVVPTYRISPNGCEIPHPNQEAKVG
ncbi:MAG: nucleoside-diphosphate sugar epimerase/dehydratase [Niameybacter sp.]